MLSGSSVELKTCNAALLEATGKSWDEVSYILTQREIVECSFEIKSLHIIVIICYSLVIFHYQYTKFSFLKDIMKRDNPC